MNGLTGHRTAADTSRLTVWVAHRVLEIIFLDCLCHRREMGKWICSNLKLAIINFYHNALSTFINRIQTVTRTAAPTVAAVASVLTKSQ